MAEAGERAEAGQPGAAAAAGHEAGAPVRHLVIIVHGVGEQAKLDTLRDFGGGFVSYVKRTFLAPWPDHPAAIREAIRSGRVRSEEEYFDRRGELFNRLSIDWYLRQADGEDLPESSYVEIRHPRHHLRIMEAHYAEAYRTADVLTLLGWFRWWFFTLDLPKLARNFLTGIGGWWRMIGWGALLAVLAWGAYRLAALWGIGPSTLLASPLASALTGGATLAGLLLGGMKLFSRWFLASLGEIHAYVHQDLEAIRIREAVEQVLVDGVAGRLPGPPFLPERIHLVTHSLGSLVGFEVLTRTLEWRLAQDSQARSRVEALAPQAPDFSAAVARLNRRLQFFSVGSPLYRVRGISRYDPRFMYRMPRELSWHNVYSRADYVAGSLSPLDGTSGRRDRERLSDGPIQECPHGRLGIFPSTSHSQYWVHPPTMGYIVEHIFEVPSPDEAPVPVPQGLVPLMEDLRSRVQQALPR